jgi:hypothetical protein
VLYKSRYPYYILGYKSWRAENQCMYIYLSVYVICTTSYQFSPHLPMSRLAPIFSFLSRFQGPPRREKTPKADKNIRFFILKLRVMISLADTYIHIYFMNYYVLFSIFVANMNIPYTQEYRKIYTFLRTVCIYGFIFSN